MAAGLAPLSVASIIIGFISFAFTLATFLRLVWGNLTTFKNAQKEVSDIMGNLKQALFEERQHLRACRRRLRGEYEEGAFKVLADGVRHMIENFKRLEEPFLEDTTPARPHSRKKSHNGQSSYELEDYYNLTYKNISVRDRFLWLSYKADIMDIADSLQKLQTRRIARQLTDVAGTTHFISNQMLDMDDRMSFMEQRITRSASKRT